MGAAYTPKNTFDVVFKDKNGHIVIWQFPNLPLWIWIIALALDLLFGNYGLHAVFRTIGTVALLLWAGMEVAWGASLFRRILGGVVIAGVIFSQVAV